MYQPIEPSYERIMGFRDQLLSDPTKPAGQLALPEYGGTVVHLRRLSVGDQMKAAKIAGDKDANVADRLIRLVRICLCEADGTPTFAEGDEAAYLIPVAVADRIVTATMAANGIGEAIDEKKANSPPTTS